MSTPFQISLAPQQLMQAINPWTFNQQGAQFGFINIDLGTTAESDLERKILDKVGSYGKQIGRIGDALDVILKHVKLGDLTPDEQDALNSQGADCGSEAGEGRTSRRRSSGRVKRDSTATAMIKPRRRLVPSIQVGQSRIQI
jgi:hypothetical protein